MMKKLSSIILGLFAVAALAFTACTDKEAVGPCAGVNCADDEVCVDGNCVKIDPCAGVTCPAGQVCINGTCQDEAKVVSGTISTDVTWTADKVYELAGKVAVISGVTLTIEPGTIVKGREGSGSLASALIIARGAKIIADGTADNPIIFTSVLDNIKIGEKSGTNLIAEDTEKWGGLIILGRAPISGGTGDTEEKIEGIPPDDNFGFYGGNDPNDNSGILRYVSVRHGGALIGDGNEINGITLGGVGAGTTIEYIEVVGNLDDGIECFGGNVNITNAIVVAQGDDAFDIDQNYAGTLDNVIAIAGSESDEALEIDGPEGTAQDGLFTIKNGTFISVNRGSGADLKSKAQGTIENCLWVGYTTFIKIRASFNNDCSNKEDAYTHLTDVSPLLNIQNCEFESISATSADMANVYDGDTNDSCAVLSDHQDKVDGAVAGNGNTIVGEGTGTKGADKSRFVDWSWASINGKL